MSLKRWRYRKLAIDRYVAGPQSDRPHWPRRRSTCRRRSNSPSRRPASKNAASATLSPDGSHPASWPNCCPTTCVRSMADGGCDWTSIIGPASSRPDSAAYQPHGLDPQTIVAAVFHAEGARRLWVQADWTRCRRMLGLRLDRTVKSAWFEHIAPRELAVASATKVTGRRSVPFSGRS